MQSLHTYMPDMPHMQAASRSSSRRRERAASRCQVPNHDARARKRAKAADRCGLNVLHKRARAADRSQKRSARAAVNLFVSGVVWSSHSDMPHMNASARKRERAASRCQVCERTQTCKSDKPLLNAKQCKSGKKRQTAARQRARSANRCHVSTQSQCFCALHDERAL